MDSPLISIVMPVYNVQNYLAWSIASVIDQNYPWFQLICVNDGSTDESGNLIDRIAQADERISVLHQLNRGPSSARNTGIRHAKGDLLIFLDSDDRLRPGALNTIAATFEATKFDVLAYGAVPYPPCDASVWLNTALSPRDTVYENFHPDILFKEQTHPFSWRTAIRRTFLEESGIMFDEAVSFGEDQLFPFRLYPRAQKTALISDKLVDYRVKRTDSLMATRFGDLNKRAAEHVEVLDRICADWSQAGYLDLWPRELFTWGVDLMLASLIHSVETESFTALRNSLSVVWQRHFSQAFLHEQMTDRIIGPVVHLVINDSVEPSKKQLMLTLFKLRQRAYGLPYALRQAAERPLQRLKSRTVKAQRAIWEEKDAAELQAAKERFELI